MAESCHTNLAVGLCWLALAVALINPIRSSAQETDELHPLLTNGFSIDIGLFYPSRELDLRVDGSLGPNDEIDFDTGFNLGNPDEVFAGELAWRFRDNWSFLAQYFKSSDTRRATLAEDVEWGDVVFGAGTNAAVGADLTITRLFVGRQLKTENRRHEVGIGGGIHWLNTGAFIEGTIIVNGITESARRSVSAEAPLPNIGAWYRYSISPRWVFRSRLDVLDASVGDYSGLLLNAGVGVSYQLFENFGLGVAYNYFELDVRVDRTNWRGKIETIYDGAYVYASVYF